MTDIKKIVFYGGTGQAKVMKAIADYYCLETIAVFDDTLNMESPFNGIPIYSGLELESWLKNRNDIHEIGFCISIGNPHGNIRLKLSKKLKHYGLTSISLTHPTAIIAKNSNIGEGAQIHAGAIIGEEVIIGNQCIINTKVSIDHECVLEDGVELTPNVTLCGNVKVENCATVYSSATILPNLIIGSNAVVGANSLVNKNIRKDIIVVGTPAKFLKKVE